MKLPEFNAAYRDGSPFRFRAIDCPPATSHDAAVATLMKIMVDPNAPCTQSAFGQLTASSTMSQKRIEIEDIEARVAELERATEASKK